VVAAVEEQGGVSLITADHGNAEQMLAADGSPHTAHTSNPVPLVISDRDVSLLEGGELSDLVPTTLALLGLAKPLHMTGRILSEARR
jgi:2,3-bisphosphoglycerate-independent phosphoglycerate mutase